MSTITHALLLTAGLGTRLRPLTLVRAKPALPVAGTPMVRRILAWLHEAGIREAVLNLHHLPETIVSATGDGSDLGVRVRYSWEHPVVLGSAGGPRQALDIIGADTFLIVNGDTLTDLALAPMIDDHRASGAQVTMAVIPNVEPHRYSGLRVAGDGAVLGVVPRGSSERSFHFIGVQVAHRRAFDGAPAGVPSNSVGDVYDRLIAAAPGSIRAHRCDARFWDIGTVTDYWSTSWAFAPSGQDSQHAGALVGAGATVTRSIAWHDVRVGERCRVDQCILTDGVHVPAGTSWSRSILMPGPDGGVLATPFSTETA
ncbi:MAG: sugar phosphate nucleotidyltransferase [Vicinamibacterales bacterium]